MRDIPKHKAVLLCSLSLVVVVGTGIAPVAAQEATAPSVTMSEATIAVDVGESSTVDATYRFQVDSVGSGEESLTDVSGTLWRFDGHAVSDLEATVDGETVDVQRDQSDGHSSLSIPLQGVEDGDTVTVGLTYTVAGTGERFKAPLWVPEFQTAGDGRVIEMTMTLPDGTQAQGAAFPKIDETNGEELTYSLLHVPGFAQVDYGQGSGGLFTVDTVSTVVGVVAIVGFLGAWLVWTRRQQAGGRNVV
ncbi:hypothetical protein [Halomarina rubra]|uniref:Uncharacterized protein n=1 Tax=Halomarina rubra TaxID=2071873 RepID=A0ABD6AX65_9EURY|nr:hypothetical protein [Halomarina rubra]